MKTLLFTLFLLLSSFAIAQVDEGVDFTITANDSLSDKRDLVKSRIIAIRGDTGWTAAHVSFRVGKTYSGTYVPLMRDSTTPYSIYLTANQTFLIPPADLAGFRYIQIQSGYGNTMYVKQLSQRKLRAYTWPIRQP